MSGELPLSNAESCRCAEAKSSRFPMSCVLEEGDRATPQFSAVASDDAGGNITNRKYKSSANGKVSGKDGLRDCVLTVVHFVQVSLGRTRSR